MLGAPDANPGLLEQAEGSLLGVQRLAALLRAQRDLAALGREIGADVSAIEAAITTLEAGAETLWNPDLACYDVRNVHSGLWAGCVSNASFLNWYAGIDHEGMEAQLERITRICRFPVPSHDPSSVRFDAKRYWRGPTWAIMNSIIAMGLRERGLTDQAEALRRSTADLITQYGFAEYFDPITGDAAGGGTFTWTAAVWLAWASPSNDA